MEIAKLPDSPNADGSLDACTEHLVLNGCAKCRAAAESGVAVSWTRFTGRDAYMRAYEQKYTDTTNPKDLVGVKKPPVDLVPAALLIMAAEAMRNGAEKYGPYNWREKKVRARIYIGAAMRHLMSWLDGEETASDSGVHHLGHAAACLAIILDAQATGQMVDDRPTAGAAARLIEQLTKK